MHLHFEKNTNTKCDCTILSLSWMGKVPDELPEDEGWKLNRTNYYQEGWLATGNVRGIVGVTFTTSHCNKALESPPRTNYNLRGHRSEVILVKWNEPYQKLASCDSSGVIFVWIKYEGRWSIELINDRNTRVTHFSWSHDGRMALICYQDGFVLVGSVAGQRYWSSMLNLECTITCGIWTPDDQQVYFGTSTGQLVVMDVHGAMVAQVDLSSPLAVTNMAWSCEKFKMEEGDDHTGTFTNTSRYVLAVSVENGCILLLKHHDDVSPVRINTGLCPLHLEWSNCRQLLSVAGTRPANAGTQDFTNVIRVYTDTGVLLYSAVIPYTQLPVTAMTWGHNDKRLFVATGCTVHMAWVSMRVASLQLLCSLQVYNRLSGSLRQLATLPLPLRIQQLVSKLFTHTIQCCVPEGSGLRDFVSRAPKVRLHCTMLRHDEDVATNCYTLYLEYLGGLVPLLKGKRTSKLKPEFVIFDPQVSDANCLAARIMVSAGSGGGGGSEKEDSEPEEGWGSPRPTRRRRNRTHPQHIYVDTLPEDARLAEVTSNIWGTKFRIHGVSHGLATSLGQVTYKTSLLHLQPRQMTLQMAGEGPPDPAPPSTSLSEDDEEGGEARGAPIAPLTRLRCHRSKNNTNPRPTNGNGNVECFMTRSSFRDCECGDGDESGVAVVGDKARRGVVRSCSVGYLDLVESGASNNRLVLVRQARPPRLSHCGKSRSLDSSDMRLGLAEMSRPPVIHQPHSQPASPALSKKKTALNNNTSNITSSPIRKRLLNSPLLSRRLRRRPDTDYQDLESFQKAQLRNKIEISSKRREFVMHNKAPMWNENSQVYQLDFGGRVTQESAKNFQVEFRGKQGPVDEPVSTALLSYGIPSIAIVSALVNLSSLALYHRSLRDAVRILWNTYRVLESKPEVLKAAVLILVAFFWHQVVLIGTLPVKTMVIYAMLIVTDLQICFIAFLVEGAFKALHLKIKEYYNLLTVSEEGQPPLYFDEPCLQQGRRAGLDLYELRQVHSQLFHVVTTANAAYNIPAFVVTVTCRFFTTLYLYRWIISKFISMQLFYALLTLQRIFYICYRFEALKRVEKATTDMVNGLDKSPLNTKTRAEFKLYLIQLKSYKMVFNSIHMFDLDFSLITSMFTTTITYLMLLQQFT